MGSNPISPSRTEFDMREIISICEKCLDLGRPCPGLTRGIPNGPKLTSLCYVKKTGDEDKDEEKILKLELERLVPQIMRLQDKEDDLNQRLSGVRARILLKQRDADPFPYKKFFSKTSRSVNGKPTDSKPVTPGSNPGRPE